MKKPKPSKTSLLLVQAEGKFEPVLWRLRHRPDLDVEQALHQAARAFTQSPQAQGWQPGDEFRMEHLHGAPPRFLRAAGIYSLTCLGTASVVLPWNHQLT